MDYAEEILCAWIINVNNIMSYFDNFLENRIGLGLY